MHTRGIDSHRAFAARAAQRVRAQHLSLCPSPRKRTLLMPRPSHIRFGLVIALTMTVLIAAVVLWPAYSEAFPKRPGGGCVPCHSGPNLEDVISASGIPAFYLPSLAYTITIVTTDTNGPSVGENSFDLLVTAGTLSSTDPNVRIISSVEAIATGDTTVASWTLIWTAPVIGDVTLTLWGVMGDGAKGKVDPWDSDIYLSSLQVIPEFPSVVPMLLALFGLVILARKAL